MQLYRIPYISREASDDGVITGIAPTALTIDPMTTCADDPVSTCVTRAERGPIEADNELSVFAMMRSSVTLTTTTPGMKGERSTMRFAGAVPNRSPRI